MYRITRALSVGRFATPERAADLLVAGVTHVLNVSHAPSQVTSGDAAFRGVAWFPLEDFRRIDEAEIMPILDALHVMASEPGAHVYVHCVAGHLRSPTVIWLYLVACGLDPAAARDVIEERSPDAAPGARRLVGPGMILHVQRHGLANYFPHPRREEVLVPFGPT
ncbi:MAG: Dual specificity phosphatase, catalytic domain [Gemmataceae bacterium]|nr:Dual specificity phosphatase, catalytic domain [Gemmataceae bacterium]